MSELDGGAPFDGVDRQRPLLKLSASFPGGVPFWDKHFCGVAGRRGAPALTTVQRVLVLAGVHCIARGLIFTLPQVFAANSVCAPLPPLSRELRSRPQRFFVSPSGSPARALLPLSHRTAPSAIPPVDRSPPFGLSFFVSTTSFAFFFRSPFASAVLPQFAQAHQSVPT